MPNVAKILTLDFLGFCQWVLDQAEAVVGDWPDSLARTREGDAKEGNFFS